MTAYVLIQTRSDAKPISSTLRTMPAVVSAEDLSGPYDAIALTSVDSARDLFETVVPGIRELPGVTQALPAPLVHALPKDRAHSGSEEAA